MKSSDEHEREQMSYSILKRSGKPSLAYNFTEGKAPYVVFLGGFASDMEGKKALFLEEFCKETERGFLRFDYSGHGSSEGDFEEGTIGKWLSDALAVIETLGDIPLILIGSSMGGWISMLTCERLSEQVKGLICLAAAPDFTEEIYMADPEACKREFAEKGWYALSHDYSDEPYKITKELIEDGKNHLILKRKRNYGIPVTLIQGMKDADVPWPSVLKVRQSMSDKNIDVLLLQEADHRLSRPEDLETIKTQLEKTIGLIEGKNLPTDCSGFVSCMISE